MISDHADPLAEVGSKEAGGQNIYVFYLATFLCQLGIFVDVYTRWDRKNKKEVVVRNSHLRIIRAKAGPKKYIPRDSLIGVIDAFAENIVKRKSREKIKYDIIHTNYWYSGLVGLKISSIIKAPVVSVYHSIGKVRFDVLKKFKTQSSDYAFFQKRIACEKQIAKKSAGIVATSTVEKEIIRRLFKVADRKIKVISIGVDTNIFKPIKTERARHLINLNSRGKIILYVGRIEWRKGIGTLIYAFRDVIKHHPNSKLYIIGGGKSRAAKKLEAAERERLAKIVHELGMKNKVVFLGAKKQSHLYRYYSAADVCVVPSYYEPFGIVPLESMACGTPVVASRTGGLKYTIKDGETGKLAEPRNYGDLAVKIREVLKKGKDAYKANCLKRISDKFTWEDIARQYQEYFNQLIKNKL